MELEHTLAVDAPVDEVWDALVNPERVVGCMPGATLGTVDGDTFTGQIKVKMGPVALLYKGTGTFVEKDAAAHRLVMEANAKDTRGNGTAKSTITMTLSGEGDKTTGTVVTDLAITGKPAQFGRGMISDVSGKIIEQFAGCLSTKLGPEVAEPVASQPDTDGVAAAAAAACGPAAARGAGPDGVREGIGAAAGAAGGRGDRARRGGIRDRTEVAPALTRFE